jgi:hypothetical protein
MGSESQIYQKAIAAIVEEELNSNSDSFVDYAEYLLCQDIQGGNIEILASLRNESFFQKNLYFQKVLIDQGIDRDEIKDVYLVYAREIARKVVNNELDPLIAVSKLDKIYLKSDSRQFYYDLIEISDGIDLLDEGYELIEGMNIANYKEYIKHAFELF